MREKKFILWQYMYAYVCIVNYKNHTFSPREGYLTLDSKMIKTNKLLRHTILRLRKTQPSFKNS